jgi:acetyl-CoA acetyltransferase
LFWLWLSDGVGRRVCRFGLASLCVVGGMGMATIIVRI